MMSLNPPISLGAWISLVARRCGVLVLLLWLAGTGAQRAHAQLPSHAYVPLEDWSMQHIEHLIRKNVIPDPLPMVRPFTVGALGRSLARVDSSVASQRELDIVARLKKRFDLDEDWVGVTLEGDAGVWTATHARRNSNLRESGDGYVYPRIGVNGVLQAGVAAVVMHPEFDPNLDEDPDFGGKDSPLDFYYPNAYLAFRSRHVSVDLGRLRRNWGPVGVRGLDISSAPYPYDHFFFMVHTNRVYGHFLVADIDPVVNSNGERSNRYLAAHRIGARPWDFIDLAVWGGQIIASPGQHWELWFINPVPVQLQTRDEVNKTSNAIIGGDGELRLGDFRIAGSLSLDDIQAFSSPDKNDEPPSYAMTAVIDWTPAVGTYTLEYSRISNLSYRTHDPAESYIMDQNPDRSRPGVGIAHNFTDYDLISLKGGFMVGHCAYIRPELSLLRQGEGDLRLPFPPPESYPDLATIHTGVVEKTFRAALLAEIPHPSGLQLSFDAGIHRIVDYQHVPGASETRFVGSARLRYVLGTSFDLE
jgi:hypothetical protein